MNIPSLRFGAVHKTNPNLPDAMEVTTSQGQCLWLTGDEKQQMDVYVKAGEAGTLTDAMLQEMTEKVDALAGPDAINCIPERGGPRVN